MNIRLKFGLFAFFLVACNNKKLDSFVQTTKENKISVDTIVGSKIITDQDGSAYRKRGIGYFLTVGKRTSPFTCAFYELKDSGKVCIDLNIPYFKDEIVYRQRIKELQKILPIAKKEFNFDSVRSIYLGRLVQNGDLAIKITEQYIQKFGSPKKITDYRKTALFLKDSQLGEDFNKIFKPYSISVKSISAEKLSFVSKKELIHMSNIETDTTKIPKKILDCMTWIILKKK